MKKLLLLFLMANTYAVNIGVIVPIQHVAMDAIVEGIQTTLKPALSKNDKIIIKNANSDINLQRQIIQQMVDNGVDYFLPIGKMASQMTLSIVKSKPVIAVAVDKATMKENEGRIGAVIDEIDVTITLDVIKNSLKKIEKIGLVYGNSEKVFPEIERAKTFCKKNGLKLFLRKADTVAEVVPNVNSLITQVDALLILKDFTVVSAMGGIAEIAYKSQTLVIASDAGSVKNGAQCAIGVAEKAIGIKAAKMVIDALNKKPLTISSIDKLILFYNTKALEKQNIVTVEQLRRIAETMSYEFRAVTP